MIVIVTTVMNERRTADSGQVGLLLRQEPGVCIAKFRHQSPEWTILSHVNCLIQGEVLGF